MAIARWPPHHAATAVRLFAGSNQAMVAGYEISGPVFRSAIPGNMRVLISRDFEILTDVAVDPLPLLTVWSSPGPTKIICGLQLIPASYFTW